MTTERIRTIYVIERFDMDPPESLDWHFSDSSRQNLAKRFTRQNVPYVTYEFEYKGQLEGIEAALANVRETRMKQRMPRVLRKYYQMFDEMKEYTSKDVNIANQFMQEVLSDNPVIYNHSFSLPFCVESPALRPSCVDIRMAILKRVTNLSDDELIQVVGEPNDTSIVDK